MKLLLVVRPEAAADVAEGRDWYEMQRQGLGLEFLTAIEKVFERVRDTPELYAAEFRGVRRAGTGRFPSIVYYRVLRNSIEILAVLHGSRNPRHWRSRAEQRRAGSH